MSEHTFQVAPAVLEWARKQRGLSVNDAAHLLSIKPATLTSIEEGARQPSLSQLHRMSDKYKRPLIVLLLDKVPTTFTALKDFRRLPETDLGTYCPALHDEIKRAIDEQETYAEIKAQLGQELERPALPDGSRDTASLAAEIVDMLGITPSQRKRWTRSRTALGEWRSRVEMLGILVLETSRVKVSEMRGFSLSEKLPLVIVLNGEDSERGKIFTLMHELAHLCLRDSGICDLHDSRPHNDIEVFCNAVAGQVLLPEVLLLALSAYRDHTAGQPWTESDVDGIVTVMGGASREVVLRRLRDNNKIEQDEYERRVRELREKYEATRTLRHGSKKGGPLPHRIQLRDRGRPFVRSAFDAYADGIVNLSQLVDLVGVRTKHLDNMQVEAYK
jgi:Zn-dependent peptidase ImmA (M78 family)/transcriptional regulator with XRE-family HTH domain